MAALGLVVGRMSSSSLGEVVDGLKGVAGCWLALRTGDWTVANAAAMLEENWFASAWRRAAAVDRAGADRADKRMAALLVRLGRAWGAGARAGGDVRKANSGCTGPLGSPGSSWLPCFANKAVWLARLTLLLLPLERWPWPPPPVLTRPGLLLAAGGSECVAAGGASSSMRSSMTLRSSLGCPDPLASRARPLTPAAAAPTGAGGISSVGVSRSAASAGEGSNSNALALCPTVTLRQPPWEAARPAAVRACGLG